MPLLENETQKEKTKGSKQMNIAADGKSLGQMNEEETEATAFAVIEQCSEESQQKIYETLKKEFE